MLVEVRIRVEYDEIADLEEVLRCIRVRQEERRRREVKPESDRTSRIVKAMDAPGPDLKKPRRKKPEEGPAAVNVAIAEVESAETPVSDIVLKSPISNAAVTIADTAAVAHVQYPTTKEHLQELFRAYAPTHVERAKSLLNQFGVNRLGELPESRYAEFAAALQQ